MRLRIRRVLDNRQLLWRRRHVMRRWIAATPGTRAAVALSVTGIVPNAIVFGLAVAVVGPYRPCTGPTGAGLHVAWLVASLVVALVAVGVVARRVGASRAETAVLALMQLSLGVGLAFLAAVLPLQADAGCQWSF
jgi:hypothetical protein